MVWFLIGAAIILILLMPKKADSLLLKKIYMDWQIELDFWANIYSIPVEYLVAIVWKESRGNETASGPTADYGLMQITKPALDDFNRLKKKNYTLEQMLDGEKNLEVGCWYLWWLRNNWKLTWEEALTAYNSGIGNLLENRKISDYAYSILGVAEQAKEVLV